MINAELTSWRSMYPRPLGLHLGLATLATGSALSALMMSRNAMLPWDSSLKETAADLEEKLGQFSIEELATELVSQGHDNITQMLAGISRYHQHSYKRMEQERKIIWQKGSVRVLDCSDQLADNAPVVFLVPSLVNRYYILDLMPGKSLVDALNEAGIRPLVIDWGTPTAEELNYSLDDYILKITGDALKHVKETFPDADLHLAGYCMGGTLAVALAQFHSEKLSSLIAIATPWDFHQDLGVFAREMLGNEMAWQSMLGSLESFPVDILQAFFASLDPSLCLNKFRMFNQMREGSDRAKEFVALEDWLNDGVPLPKKVAMSCFSDWYGSNKTVAGMWEVDGEKIQPEHLKLPAMVALPKSDRIVPPKSALALANQLPNAEIKHCGSGHIGMMVGSSARDGLWQDVIKWVHE